MKIQNLQDCFSLKLMAIYDVETQLVKALPKMVKTANNEALKEALSGHLAETEEHVRRLENIFESIDMKPKKVKVMGMKGLIEDASWCMEQDATTSTMDTMIISGGRHIENYEIQTYTTLVEWAKVLDLTNAQDLLNETLEEEKNADMTLSEMAEEINIEANTNETEESDGMEDDDVK